MRIESFLPQSGSARNYETYADYIGLLESGIPVGVPRLEIPPYRVHYSLEDVSPSGTRSYYQQFIDYMGALFAVRASIFASH